MGCGLDYFQYSLSFDIYHARKIGHRCMIQVIALKMFAFKSSFTCMHNVANSPFNF